MSTLTTALVGAIATAVVSTGAVTAPQALAQAERASTAWTSSDERGDQRRVGSVARRHPRMARAVDIREQTYLLDDSGLRITTTVAGVVRGPGKKQFLWQTVRGSGGRVDFAFLFGAVSGPDFATAPGKGATPCPDATFTVFGGRNRLVSFIPVACLPAELTTVETISFAEARGADVATDEHAVEVPAG